MVEEFKTLFQNMVAYDVQERYTIEDVLEDAWMKNFVADSLKAEDFN